MVPEVPLDDAAEPDAPEDVWPRLAQPATKTTARAISSFFMMFSLLTNEDLM